MTKPDAEIELLSAAGRLLLGSNESTGAIRDALLSTARALAIADCHIAIRHNEVTIAIAGSSPRFSNVSELRNDVLAQTRVHAILERVRREELDAAAAVIELREVERAKPRHARATVVLATGSSAAGLALLLGADAAAALVVSVASALGLIVRQELARRSLSSFTTTAAAGFVGAILGSVAIRLEVTQAAELTLIVPGLMLVPGPYLINGLLDWIDYHISVGIARLVHAAGLLAGAAVGIIAGLLLAFLGTDMSALAPHRAAPSSVSLPIDMALAGIATCGFAALYNSSWPQIGMAMVGGMTGHGVRYMALYAGCGLELSTFIGAMVVGAAAALMARSAILPVATIAYAGAVTMIPGLQIYRALGQAFIISRLKDAVDPSVIANSMGNALQACLVLGALALGLIVGVRFESKSRPEASSADGRR